MFCVFLNVRYANEKLMHVGHNFLKENFDANSLKGFQSLKGYHLTPDKGLGIICFDSEINLKKNIPVIKEMFADYQDRFNCKITFDTGIENHDLFINK